MELRTLNYFVAVAKERSFSKAAKGLHISQPALSKQLQQLESQLGVQLFNRDHRQVTLTSKGLYLLNQSQTILDLVDKTTQNLLDEQQVTGTITIGGGETQSMRSVAHVMKEFLQKYPQVKINLYSGNADDVLNRLENGLIDFGLVLDPVVKEQYNYLTLPTSNIWGLLLKRDHPLAQKQTIVPEDLKQVALYVSSQKYNDNFFTDWLGCSLDNLQIKGTYNLLYNASILVQEDLGAALCLDGIINTQGTDLVFKPLEPRLAVSLNIIWKKEQELSTAAQLFLKRLQLQI